MKKTLLGMIPLMLAAQVASAQDCTALSGCDKKICELETKLGSVSEPHAAARIKAALAETKANCTDDKVTVDHAAKDTEHQMKTEKKIREAKEDIAEAEVKKQKAQAEGKAEKVLKYQHKIEEKQLKIKHLQADH